jgi:hypothetical protein
MSGEGKATDLPKVIDIFRINVYFTIMLDYLLNVKTGNRDII